jgi:membrane protein YqaA with SNARE-associated domain
MPLEKTPLKAYERSLFTKLAHLVLALWNRIQTAWFRWADLNQHSAWFPFLVGALVALDSLIVILPGDLLIALSVLSNPRGWKKLALAGGIGSALGAFCLYLMIHQFGPVTLENLSNVGAPTSVEELSQPSPPQSDLEESLAPINVTHRTRLQVAKTFYRKYGGPWSLALGSVIPFFGWLPVVAAGLLSDAWFQILMCLLLGRIVRFWIVAFGMREGWAMFTTLRDEAKQQKLKRQQQRDGGG